MTRILPAWVLGRSKPDEFGRYHTAPDDPLPTTFVASSPDECRAILFQAFAAIEARHWCYLKRPWLSWEEAMHLAGVGTDHLWAGTILPSQSADGNLSSEGDEDE